MIAGFLLLAPLVCGGVAEQLRPDRDHGVIDDRNLAVAQVPTNDGWVTDLAGMLSPEQERELEALMESYKQGSTHEVALLTVPNLNGRPIEEFALDVGRAWGLGSQATSNGALLVVAKEDRTVRIEVGRGLEGSLTDAQCGRIIRNVIVPAFKRGEFAEGLKDGVVAIHEAIGGKYGRIAKGPRPVEVGLVGLVPFLVFGIILIVILIRISRWGGWGGGGRGYRGPHPGGWIGFPGGGGLGGGGFSGFGGGGGFSGGGASGRW